MKKIILILVFVLLAVVILRLPFNNRGNTQESVKILTETREKTDDDLGPGMMEKWEPICTVYLDAYHPIMLYMVKHKSGAFSPDMKYFAMTNKTMNYDLVTNLFDLRTGENLLHQLGKTATPSIVPVAFSPDSKLLAFAKENEFVIWNIEEKKIVTTVERYMEKNTCSLQFSNDRKYLYYVAESFTNTGASHEIGYIWDVETGKLIDVIEGNVDDRTNFSCYPDFSRAMVSQKWEKRYFIRDLETGVDLERMPNFNENSHTSKEFSNDMRYFANQSGREVRLSVWDAETGSDICTIPIVPDHLRAYTFLPDNKTFVTVVDPNPKNSQGYRRYDYIPKADPLPIPPIEGETHAIIEFWDLDDLIWDKHQANIFPKRTRICYLEGETTLCGLVASPDGKLLYANTDKNVKREGNSNDIGYIFAIDPNEKIELPAELKASKESYKR